MFTMNPTVPCITFNGVPLAAYHAKVQSEYKIEANTLTTNTFKSNSRSTFNVLSQDVGMLTLKLPIDFWAESKAQTVKCISDFNAAICGKVLIDMKDGFYYQCFCSDMGTCEWINDEWATCDYEFTGVRVGEEIVIQPESSSPEGRKLEIYNPGNYPRTDVRIEVNSDSLLHYSLTVTLTNEAEETVLSYKWPDHLFKNGHFCIDGIDNEIVEYDSDGNKTSIAGSCYWTNFPYFVPGKNYLTVKFDGELLVPDYFTITYRPAYM